MRLRVITVGKKNDAFLADAITEYSNRINRYTNLEWETISVSGQEGIAARDEESQAILQRLKDGELVWLLDGRGQQLTSPALADKIEGLQNNSTQSLTVVIGGSYGVSDAVMARAGFTWSLSLMVFPHQLVRLILAEQLYRAFSINAGSKYHHE